MKRNVRLLTLAVALVIACGGFLTHRFDVAAKCTADVPLEINREEHESETPRLVPALPGMRFLTRAGAAL